MKKMIIPTDLQSKCEPLDVSGKYDWNQQIYLYDSCKIGTHSSTSVGTGAPGNYDTNWDSVND